MVQGGNSSEQSYIKIIVFVVLDVWFVITTSAIPAHPRCISFGNNCLNSMVLVTNIRAHPSTSWVIRASSTVSPAFRIAAPSDFTIIDFSWSLMPSNFTWTTALWLRDKWSELTSLTLTVELGQPHIDAFWHFVVAQRGETWQWQAACWHLLKGETGHVHLLWYRLWSSLSYQQNIWLKSKQPSKWKISMWQVQGTVSALR